MPANTPLQGFRVPVSTDDPDVVDDMTQLALGIERRVLQVYGNASARDAANTAPDEGQFAYLRGNDTLTMYTGSAWVTFPPVQPAITSGTSVPPNSSGANGDVFFKV